MNSTNLVQVVHSNSDLSRVILDRPVHTLNLRRRRQGWRWAEKFSKLVPEFFKRPQYVTAKIDQVF